MEISRFQGFKIVELNNLLPDVVEVGDHREGADWRGGTHTQKHWTIFYVVEGTNRLRIEGGAEISMKPGSIGCLTPNVRHTGQYGPELKHRLLWVSFKLTAIDGRNPEWNLTQYFDRPRFAHGITDLECYFLQLIREATRPSIHQACGLRLALDTLVLEVVRAIEEPRRVLSILSSHPAISKACGILESRFKSNWTVGALAREVGLSRSRLAELFNVEVGYSIHKFLNRVRIRHAERLLSESDLPIADIATDSGFATRQHFSQVFKKMNGQSPIDFRRDGRPRVG